MHWNLMKNNIQQDGRKSTHSSKSPRKLKNSWLMDSFSVLTHSCLFTHSYRFVSSLLFSLSCPGVCLNVLFAVPPLLNIDCCCVPPRSVISSKPLSSSSAPV
uniref:Uncharacterized protein n=1 Tax=Cacopsylla melanoneura TaxID=428564 RepID=A0A8D8UNC7_9HEMI